MKQIILTHFGLTFSWDIALLQLTTDAVLNNYVQLGSLPPSGQILPNRNPCYITGWGRTQSESQPHHTFILREKNNILKQPHTTTHWIHTHKTIRPTPCQKYKRIPYQFHTLYVAHSYLLISLTTISTPLSLQPEVSCLPS